MGDSPPLPHLAGPGKGHQKHVRPRPLPKNQGLLQGGVQPDPHNTGQDRGAEGTVVRQWSGPGQVQLLWPRQF